MLAADHGLFLCAGVDSSVKDALSLHDALPIWEGRSVRDPIGASDAPGPYSWSSSELPPLRTTSSKTYWTEFMETTFTVARSDSSPGGSPSTLADQNTAR